MKEKIITLLQNTNLNRKEIAIKLGCSEAYISQLQTKLQRLKHGKRNTNSISK